MDDDTFLYVLAEYLKDRLRDGDMAAFLFGDKGKDQAWVKFREYLEASHEYRERAAREAFPRDG